MRVKNKLIIFDFDGVLVDTLEVGFSINKEIHENLTIEEYKSFFEGNVYSALRSDGTQKKHHPNFFNLYDNRSRKLEIPRILRESVSELSKIYKIAIISSTYTNSIKTILKREKVEEYFDDILGADIERDKKIKIRSLLKKYNLNPEDSIMITDTLGDIKEASECNVVSIAVTWGFHDKEKLSLGNPAAIVYKQKDLLREIIRYLK